MIYREAMLCMNDAKHNFYIYKMVRMLWKLSIIDANELDHHSIQMWNSKPVGLGMDLENYSVGHTPEETYHF